MERRDFIKSAGLVAGIAAASTLGQRSANAETAQQPGAKRMAYEIKPFSLDPKSVKGISEKILISHYENNYVGAVKRLNAIAVQLTELDFAKAPNFLINGLKREELVAMNSMILHEAYFDSLGGGGAARGALGEAIARDFGSVDRWRAEFSAMGKAEGGGSGWVLLCLFAARQAAGQSMGGRSHQCRRRRPAGDCARHVRTRLSHGLWRQGCVHMSMPSWRPSTGITQRSCTSG